MKWIIVLLIILNAGWMFTDGVRAFVLGDYVTPSTGEYAGQLGPWASVLTTMGLEPRSTFVKAALITYGLASFVAVIGFANEQPWGRSALIVMAVLGLWYLPVGTTINMICLILLFLFRREYTRTSSI